MRTIIIAFTALFSCSTPSPAHELREQYDTMFLLNWTYNCSQFAVQPLLRQGMPQQLAMQSAIQMCGCTIDGFRRDISKQQLMMMSSEEKNEFSAGYAEACLNKGMGWTRY